MFTEPYRHCSGVFFGFDWQPPARFTTVIIASTPTGLLRYYLPNALAALDRLDEHWMSFPLLNSAFEDQKMKNYILIVLRQTWLLSLIHI